MDDAILVFDDGSIQNKTSQCYTNSSSFTISFVELFDAFAAKSLKRGNHAEVTANQLKQHAKELRMAKAKEFRGWLDNKTIIFVSLIRFSKTNLTDPLSLQLFIFEDVSLYIAKYLKKVQYKSPPYHLYLLIIYFIFTVKLKFNQKIK